MGKVSYFDSEVGEHLRCMRFRGAEIRDGGAVEDPSVRTGTAVWRYVGGIGGV